MHSTFYKTSELLMTRSILTICFCNSILRKIENSVSCLACTLCESCEKSEIHRCAWMTHGSDKNAEKKETREKEDGERRKRRGRWERSGRCHSAAHKLYEILIMAPLVGWTPAYSLRRVKEGQVLRDRRRQFVNPSPGACRSSGLPNKFLLAIFRSRFFYDELSLCQVILFRVVDCLMY